MSAIDLTVQGKRSECSKATLERKNRGSGVACLSCKKLKMLCEPNTFNGSKSAENPCRRCKRAGRICRFPNERRSRGSRKTAWDGLTSRDVGEDLKQCLHNALFALFQYRASQIPSSSTSRSQMNWSHDSHAFDSRTWEKVAITESTVIDLLYDLSFRARQKHVSADDETQVLQGTGTPVHMPKESQDSLFPQGKLFCSELTPVNLIDEIAETIFRRTGLGKAKLSSHPEEFGTTTKSPQSINDARLKQYGASIMKASLNEQNRGAKRLADPVFALSCGLISLQDARQLVQVYFDKCAIHLCLLDPVLHTSERIWKSSEILFMTLCAVASRQIPRFASFNSKLFAIVESMLSWSDSNGYKSIEILQTLILLAMWKRPLPLWQSDLSASLSNAACRMASDLKMHDCWTVRGPKQASKGETNLLDELNEQRTCLLVFAVNRSLSSQRGEPPLSQGEDEIVKHSFDWANQPWNSAQDVFIAAYTDLYRVLSNILLELRRLSALPQPSGSSGLELFELKLLECEARLEDWKQSWTLAHPCIFHEVDDTLHSAQRLRDVTAWERKLTKMGRLYSSFRYDFARLMMFSCAMHYYSTSLPYFSTLAQSYFQKCFALAEQILKEANTTMRFAFEGGPDNLFVLCCFANLIIFKVCKFTKTNITQLERGRKLAVETKQVWMEISQPQYDAATSYVSILKTLISMYDDALTQPFTKQNDDTPRPRTFTSMEPQEIHSRPLDTTLTGLRQEFASNESYLSSDESRSIACADLESILDDAYWCSLLGLQKPQDTLQ